MNCALLWCSTEVWDRFAPRSCMLKQISALCWHYSVLILCFKKFNVHIDDAYMLCFVITNADGRFYCNFISPNKLQTVLQNSKLFQIISKCLLLQKIINHVTKCGTFVIAEITYNTYLITFFSFLFCYFFFFFSQHVSHFSVVFFFIDLFLLFFFNFFFPPFFFLLSIFFFFFHFFLLFFLSFFFLFFLTNISFQVKFCFYCAYRYQT